MKGQLLYFILQLRGNFLMKFNLLNSSIYLSQHGTSIKDLFAADSRLGTKKKRREMMGFCLKV